MVLNTSLFCFTYYEGAKVRCFLSISDNGALSYPYFLRQSPDNRPTIARQGRPRGGKRGGKGGGKGASDIWSDRALAFPIRPAEMGKQLEQLLQL